MQAEVFAKVEELFKDAPDLCAAFRDFLPGAGAAQDSDSLGMLRGSSTRTGTPTGEHARAQKRKQPAESTAAPASAPTKRRRKVAERDKEKERDAGRATGSRVSIHNLISSQQCLMLRFEKAKQHPTGREPPAFSHFSTIPAPSSPRRSGHTFSHLAPPPPTPQIHAQPGTTIGHPQPLAPSPNFDEAQFFPRVKATLDSRETYHEFLKLVNLFTQDSIDRARLVRESRSFLGEGELMAQFKEILGWDEAVERSALAKEREELYQPPVRPLTILDRPSREELNIRYGSYRRLPADVRACRLVSLSGHEIGFVVQEINVECSGRDEMCKSVLNDEWVSHPSFSSEDSVFMAHKKNLYEEALHRTEEERHEYDFHIDALVRTIGVLEPLNHKIMGMSTEERAIFRIKPNFGGAGKAVHQRIIKKIYGREAGLEVLQAMQDTPALALPVVLARLKQKEGEWKRAQREWNKIWRAVDAANYARSLDHQGITFKTADKKALTTKAFVAHIEAIMETQMARRAALVDPLYARARPQHQLAYEIEDSDVLRDAIKLAFSYLSRLSGTQLRLDAARKSWIEIRLYSIVRAFFQLNDWDERPSVGRTRGPWKHSTAPNPHPTGIMTSVPAEAMGGTTSGTVGGVSDDADSSVGPSTPRSAGLSARNGALPTNFSGDLRKSLLKSEQAKSSRGQTHPLPSPSPKSSRKPSPVPMTLDEESSRCASPGPLVPPAIAPDSSSGGGEKRRSKRRSFFTSTWFYTLLRMTQVRRSRKGR
jgi:paired amphipathic helix protein Sin3a